MNRRTFVVVGVGNFGSWWALGLLKVPGPVTVFCLDPDRQSRSRLGERLNVVPARLFDESTVAFVDVPEELPPYSDAVVIATNADVRYRVFCELREVHQSKQWILEKPLAQSVVETEGYTAIEHPENLYVNHSRPLQPASMVLRSILDSFGLPRSVQLRGGNYELANNATHFVHLASSLLRTNFTEVSRAELSERWHESSTRPGFLDVAGSITVALEGDVEVVFDWSEPNRRKSEWTFCFRDHCVTYCELSGEIRSQGKLIATVPLVNFSSLVPQIVEANESAVPMAGLPRLLAVLPIHRALTEVLAEHYGRSIGRDAGLVPFG